MIDKINESNTRKIVKYAAIALAALLVLIIWPFYSVPTGSRGVVTTFGAITGIEGEGLAVLPPWRKLTIFNIRAEQADVENAEGSTNDQQTVHVSLTVRYSPVFGTGSDRPARPGIQGHQCSSYGKVEQIRGPGDQHRYAQLLVLGLL